MFQNSVRHQIYSNALTIETNQVIEGDLQVATDLDVAGSAANVEVLLAIDVSKLKAIAMVANGACTIKTNDSGTPDNTITLVANVPYVWTTSSYDACKITADVASIFVSNGIATPINLRILGLVDA